MEAVRADACPRVCVFVNIADAREWPFYAQRLTAALRGMDYDMYAAANARSHSRELERSVLAVRADGDGGRGTTEVLQTAADGCGSAAAGGWIAAMRRMLARFAGRVPYEIVLWVNARDDGGSPTWRVAATDAVLRSADRARACVRLLDSDRGLGALAWRGWIRDEGRPAWVDAAARRLGLPLPSSPAFPFPGDIPFWARMQPLSAPFAALGPAGLDAAEAALQRDDGGPGSWDAPGIDPRALDRLAGAWIAAAGLELRGLPADSDPSVDLPAGSGPERPLADAVVGRVIRPSPPGGSAGLAATAIEGRYREALRTASDINEHLATLYDYARRCSHVTECANDARASTWAFAAGLLRSARESGGARVRLVQVDRDRHPGIDAAMELCPAAGVDHAFVRGDDTRVEIEPTDLLFLDSWHVFCAMRAQLRKHHERVRRWIVMHDTTVDEWVGESVRLGRDIAAESRASGYPPEQIRIGIWPAIVEFLSEHPREWRMAARWTNCNGLTVLERRAEV